MPFSFPSNPTVGQQSTQNGRVYAWTGAAWELATSIASHTHSLSDLTQSGATTNQVIAWSGTAWAPAAAATGTVTSVGLSLPSIFSVSGSPVTGSGTLTGSLATQAANLVFAGPTTGSAAAPTFRSLVSGDLPSHTHSAADITSGRLTSARLPTGAQFTGGADFSGTVTFFGTVQSDSWNITNAGVATLTSVAANLSGSSFGTAANVPLITGTGGTIVAGSFGTSANTFCVGNDPRLSDSRTPTSHTHGNLTNAGAIGSTSGQIVVTTTSGVLTTATIGSGLTLSGGTLSSRITISNASPTGGSDGDIWLKY